jgi:hypothetical protein
MTFNADQLFAAAYEITSCRTVSACREWNRLQGSQQQSFLALANGCSDLDGAAMDLINRLLGV